MLGQGSPGSPGPQEKQLGLPSTVPEVSDVRSWSLSTGICGSMGDFVLEPGYVREGARRGCRGLGEVRGRRGQKQGTGWVEREGTRGECNTGGCRHRYDARNRIAGAGARIRQSKDHSGSAQAQGDQEIRTPGALGVLEPICGPQIRIAEHMSSAQRLVG